jgi:hypothetical protein
MEIYLSQYVRGAKGQFFEYDRKFLLITTLIIVTQNINPGLGLYGA